MAHKVLITDIETGKVVLDCVSSGYIYSISDDEMEGIHAAHYFGGIPVPDIGQLMNAIEHVIEDIREYHPDIAAFEAFLKAALESGLIEKETRPVENSYEEAESDE
jgi:hypothetical protein